jgi:cytochrome c oxidase assembly protein subunit 15
MSVLPCGEKRMRSVMAQAVHRVHRFNPQMQLPRRHISALHVVALLAAAATFPLIFMGGLVTSHGAGLSVPDWPNSWGYNMFLFPPRLWRGGIWYEHIHRLMGTIVGMLSIALMIAAWKLERRRWVRWLCTGVLGAVIVQGVLGGLRVVLVKLDLAIVHACVAQAFFCLATLAAVVTSRWWIDCKATGSPSGRALIVACLFAIAAIYLQLVVGAVMRHYEAGLAVPDFPLAYGQLIPAIDQRSLHAINQQRIWTMDLPPVTAAQICLHMAHRIGAAVVTLTVLLVAGIVLVRHRAHGVLLRPAIALIVLLAAQIALGTATVLYRKPADVASAHVAIGALILVTMFVLILRSMRLFARSWRVAPQHSRTAFGLERDSAGIQS